MTRIPGFLLLMLSACIVEADIIVQDDFGNSVQIQNPAKRIVSLAPHLTELLFQLEAGDSIVGAVEFSDFPPQAREIKRVGNAFALSVEAIVKLAPDLIVAWGSGGSREQLRKLQSLGIPVYYSEPRLLTDVGDSILRIALLAGKEQVGLRVKEEFDSRLAEHGRSANSAIRPRVFFQISSMELYTVNDRQLIGQAISLCGGDNIFGSLDVPIPLVSIESILVGQPGIIIRSSGDNEKDNWRDRWAGYAQIPAVSAGYLYEIPADLISRPGFRMLQGIDRLCDIILEVVSGSAG